MSQVEQDQRPTVPSPDDDPLSHLHKMSTTAGLGSTDYVAISPTAILALVSGLACFFLLFDLDQPILLVIPLTALVTGFIAFRQIAKSNGTQTGRGIASLGMLLGLVFIGLFIGRVTTTILQAKKDQAGIEATIHELANGLKAADYEKAYALFTDRFHQRIPVTKFTDVMKPAHSNASYGDLKDITWKQLADFQNDESGARVAAAFIMLEFAKASELKEQAIFRYVGDRWMIDDLPWMFPSERQPGQRGQ
jgi:hypothetical protein